MPTDRRQGRILAMQALCHWEIHKDAPADALMAVLSQGPETKSAIRYAKRLLQQVCPEQAAIDRRLGRASSQWTPVRMSPVDRNVMRVAVAEFLDQRVPDKVAINEAIEIARVYGGAESPKFVNGVLDQVKNTLESEREEGG